MSEPVSLAKRAGEFDVRRKFDGPTKSGFDDKLPAPADTLE
jgi:hypothetical protein